MAHKARRFYVYGARCQGVWTLTCLNLSLAVTAKTLIDARDQLEQRIHAHLAAKTFAGPQDFAVRRMFCTWMRFLTCRLHLPTTTRRQVCDILLLD